MRLYHRHIIIGKKYIYFFRHPLKVLEIFPPPASMDKGGLLYSSSIQANKYWETHLGKWSSSPRCLEEWNQDTQWIIVRKGCSQLRLRKPLGLQQWHLALSTNTSLKGITIFFAILLASDRGTANQIMKHHVGNSF